MDQSVEAGRPGRFDFWKFWLGQSISVLGSTFTQFALPLLVYTRTESAVNLGLSSAAGFLPYPLFGLLLGALADRVDRKRMMVLTDVGRALIVLSLPLLATLGELPLWWIYIVNFISSTLSIAFHAAEFAVLPGLVPQDDLLKANSRITATHSVAFILGPLLAGLLIRYIPIETLLTVDALSFIVSGLSILLIRRSFNQERRERKSLRQDIGEGLRYVIGHPVLRSIALMLSLLNLVGTTVFAQSVLFAKERLGAADSQLGLLYASGSAGVIVLSLAGGQLRKRWSFGTLALGSMLLEGLMAIALAFVTSLWAALPIWALFTGAVMLFNVNLNSLRQAIVPNHLLGRVVTTGRLLATSATPVGTLLGGWVIERTQNVALVYGVIGAIIVVTTVAFSFSALGRSEHYLAEERGARSGRGAGGSSP
jgi:MFS family permease